MVGGQLMRIPYTAPLPAPTIIPASASTIPGAINALTQFLTSTKPHQSSKTLLLTGAGISVASGLADYRGTKGTYTLNKTYRPIYYHEFCASHAARKRYWARSYLGWTTLNRSLPNAAHLAVKDLGRLGYLSSVITQNVDSFHPTTHPTLRTLELHGYLRSAICISCRKEYNRADFQKDLSTLNPSWHAFLNEMLDSGALSTENPEERRRRGLKTNPDGDVDIPGVEYNTFRYPACPSCLAAPPPTKDGGRGRVEVDVDGAWSPTSTAGVLKPAVIMFGESIPEATKIAAEKAVDEAGKVLVLGSSLATYSAWRLVKRARDRGLRVGIVNIGGVRGEESFFSEGTDGIRCALPLEVLLPELVGGLTASVDLGQRAFQPAPWAYR